MTLVNDLGRHVHLSALSLNQIRVNALHHAEITQFEISVGADQDIFKLNIQVGQIGLRV